MELTKSAQSTALRLQIKLTKSVTYTYGKASLTRFEEIFEECYIVIITLFIQFTICYNLLIAFS